MVQAGASKTNDGKRPLGSRQGVLRAQELNDRLRRQRVAQSTAGNSASQKRVEALNASLAAKRQAAKTAAASAAVTDKITGASRAGGTSRPVARTAFERKLLEQQRQRAAQAQRGSVQRGSAQRAQVQRGQVQRGSQVRPAGQARAQGAVSAASAKSAASVKRGAKMPGQARARVVPDVAIGANGASARRAQPRKTAPVVAEAKATPASATTKRAPVVPKQVATAARQQRQPETLRRPTMTPEIKQRPLGQPRYHEDIDANTPVGELAGLTDYDPYDLDATESPAATEPEVAPEPKKKTPRSPFLKSVQVEKRPLSHRVAPGEAVPSEVFADFDEQDIELTPPPPATEPRKRSVWPLVGLILLTVVLGGAVGAAVYLLVFQEF